jgi:ABC-type transport system involved in cytochrome c biogenesis permease component
MRFIAVAERELRVASRRKATHRIRWITVLTFLGLLMWVLEGMGGWTSKGAGAGILRGLSVVTLIFCVVLGAALTADALSRERRDGTLGLLFLTNLSSAEIIAGKVCASGIGALCGLLAVFPLLALPLLMGGVTFEHFWRLVLALVTALFASMSAGLLVSVVSLRPFRAMAMAIGVGLFMSFGLMGIAEGLRAVGTPPIGWVEGVGMLSPFYALTVADEGRRIMGQNRFWMSLGMIWGVALLGLAVVAWWLGRSWRDRENVRGRGRAGIRDWMRVRGSRGRVGFRHRMLKINPYFWLAGRHRVSSPMFMGIVVVLVLVTVYLVAPYWGRVVGAGAVSPVAGHLIAWFFAGVAIHVLVMYYAATVAAQGLAEDKQSGALELVLSAPIAERTISRGLWMAYVRKMFGPGLIAVLVHLYFVWQLGMLMVLEPPGRLAPGTTAWSLVGMAFFCRTPASLGVEWHVGFMMRVLGLALVVVVGNWLAIGWAGRWLGLRMRHPGFAPLVGVVLMLLPPWLIFSIVCYWSGDWGWSQMSQREYLPLMMWIGFGTGMLHSVVVGHWAAERLRRDFRSTVSGEYEARISWRRWVPGRGSVMRIATAGVIVALMVPGYFVWQNWRSRRAWLAFERELAAKGERLDVGALIPEPVPDELNVARTAIFLEMGDLDGMGSVDMDVLNALRGLESEGVAGMPLLGGSWMRQEYSGAVKRLGTDEVKAAADSQLGREAVSMATLERLRPLMSGMEAMAGMTYLPYFQWTTDGVRGGDVQASRVGLSRLERWHFLFQLRACARLGVGSIDEAGEDVLASLRLADLGRQSADVGGSIRVQVMLMRSLQPVWEGLAERRWSATQLADFQVALEGFDLLSDHVRAVRRAVLVNVETWRRYAEAEDEMGSMGKGSWLSGRQPRGWWLDRCRQLYWAGQRAIERVDIAGVRVRIEYDWIELDGLPIGGEVMTLLQSPMWYGASPALVSVAQTSVNQAIIACALERRCRVTGVYPEELGSLMPDYVERVPKDVITGRPMLYRRTGEGYELRGVGPNQVSDERTQGGGDDWIWGYPLDAEKGEGAEVR